MLACAIIIVVFTILNWIWLSIIISKISDIDKTCTNIMRIKCEETEWFGKDRNAR